MNKRFFFKTVFWFCRNIFAVFMKWNVHETYAASCLLKNKNVQSFCDFIFCKTDDFIESLVESPQRIQSIIEICAWAVFFDDVLSFVKLFLNISSISPLKLLRTANESKFETFVNTTFMNFQHLAHKSISDSAVDTVKNVVFESLKF